MKITITNDIGVVLSEHDFPGDEKNLPMCLAEAAEEAWDCTRPDEMGLTEEQYLRLAHLLCVFNDIGNDRQITTWEEFRKDYDG